ncbi:MAG: HupE/UreJ family protein, partial [Chromatiales bacterium]
PDSALHRHVVDVPGGVIDGAVIHFVGLESTITDVFARFVWLDGSETTAVAHPSQPWIEVIAQRSVWRVAWDYTVLGVDHILSGFDHLTFVLALLLIVNGARRLLITVTSVTLAHSIKLAAATLGVLWVPGPPIEAVIALSILFLASELVKVNRGLPSLACSAQCIRLFLIPIIGA